MNRRKVSNVEAELCNPRQESLGVGERAVLSCLRFAIAPSRSAVGGLHSAGRLSNRLLAGRSNGLVVTYSGSRKEFIPRRKAGPLAIDDDRELATKAGDIDGLVVLSHQRRQVIVERTLYLLFDRRLLRILENSRGLCQRSAR